MTSVQSTLNKINEIFLDILSFEFKQLGENIQNNGWGSLLENFGYFES